MFFFVGEMLHIMMKDVMEKNLAKGIKSPNLDVQQLISQFGDNMSFTIQAKDDHI